jgi:hypothetical protein
MTDGHNSNAKLRGYIEEIDHYDDALDTMRGEYMNECKGPRTAIKEIMQTAKDNDVNMVAFKILLKEHREWRRHEKRLAEIDMVDKASYESMVAALGEFGATPLGESALKRAKQKDEARVGA